MDQVLQYHLEELDIQVDQDLDENYLHEPPPDTPLNYEQVMNMYMRPVYAEQKGEMNRLQSIIQQKESQVERIEKKLKDPEDPLNDIA